MYPSYYNFNCVPLWTRVQPVLLETVAAEARYLRQNRRSANADQFLSVRLADRQFLFLFDGVVMIVWQDQKDTQRQARHAPRGSSIVFFDFPNATFVHVESTEKKSSAQLYLCHQSGLSGPGANDLHGRTRFNVIRRNLIRLCYVGVVVI